MSQHDPIHVAADSPLLDALAEFVDRVEASERLAAAGESIDSSLQDAS